MVGPALQAAPRAPRPTRTPTPRPPPYPAHIFTFARPQDWSECVNAWYSEIKARRTPRARPPGGVCVAGAGRSMLERSRGDAGEAGGEGGGRPEPGPIPDSQPIPDSRPPPHAWRQSYAGGFSPAAGHATQMVWKASTRLGCASKQAGGGKSGAGGARGLRSGARCGR